MTDKYIYCWSTFPISKFIIGQDIRKKCFLLYYLENVLTKSFFLLLGPLLINLDIQLLRLIYFSYTIL